MNLEIKDRRFLVCGATSGFGKSVAKGLLHEGAQVIAVARGGEKLANLKSQWGDQVETIQGDITKSETIATVYAHASAGSPLSGILVNAGGPPAKSFLETRLEDWDNAYTNILRWKVEITQTFLPMLLEQQYGRIVYIESASVKQPIENLVLSNSLRLGVVGFVKTLSQEIAEKGITLNVIAPGYHATPAMDRLFVKKSEAAGISPEEARRQFESEIKMGYLGDPDQLGSLCLWLLSPHSGYITGQTFSVDGGLIKGTMG